MGSKKYVSAATMPLMGSSNDPIKDAVFMAVLKEESIADGIINETLTGISSKIRPFYNYAKDHYTLALPSARTGGLITLPDTDVIPCVQDNLDITDDMILDYNFTTVLTEEMIILPALTEQRGFDLKTKRISIYPPGMVVPTEMWSYVSVNNVLYTDDFAEMEITYDIHKRVLDTYVVTQFVETLPYDPDLLVGGTYCIAKFATVDVNGAMTSPWQWWFYNTEVKTYPSLTPDVSNSDTFMPVIPLRYLNTDLTVDKTTALYQTSKKLLDKTDVNIDDVAALINENPNVAEIDNAYVMFGVNLQDPEEASIKYLIEFFDNLHDVSLIKEADFVTSMRDATIPSTNTYSILGLQNNTSSVSTTSNYWVSNPIDKISLVEHGLNIVLNYNYINSTVESGNIGKVGTATIQKTIYAGLGIFTLPTASIGTLTLKQQITPTLVKVIVVSGLSHTNYIAWGMGITTTIADVINDPDNNNLVIPINYGLLNKMPVNVRGKVFTESYQVVLNSAWKVHTKWYSKGWFKVVLVVVAVVIAVLSGGLGAWFSAMLVAIGNGVVAFLVFVAVNVAISLAIQTAFKYVTKILGPELGAIVGLVISIVAIVANPTSSIKVLGTSLNTSQTLLSASSVMITEANEIMAYEQKTVSTGMQADAMHFDEEMQKLNDILMTLDNRADFDPLVFTIEKKIKQLPEESVKGFYNRTIHTGNVGVLSLNMVENFVYLNTRLPNITYI